MSGVPVWRLGLAAWLLIALFTRPGTNSAHEWSRLGTVESIVERHNYWLEESQFRGTRDKVFRDGHFYSHQPPLLATLASPVYWVIHRATGWRFSNSTAANPAVYLFVLLTNGVAFALTVVLLRKLLVLAGAGARLSTAAALVLPLGTWLFPYAVVTNNHGISAMLVTAMAYAMLVIELRGADVTAARLLGGALGLMTAFEVLPIVSFVPAAALFIWLRRDRLQAAHLKTIAVWFVVPLVAHAILNIPITGDVVPAGFHTELFEFEGTTFTPIELTGSVKPRSAAELRAYAIAALVTDKGYFTLAPIMAIGLVAGVAGWSWWARARATQLALLLGSTASLGAALVTTNNLGGVAVGFRHATYLAPAFLVLLAPLFASPRRAARIGAAAVMTIALASAIVLGWYAVRNPWGDLHLPLPAPFNQQR
jgi:hypothetical protein